MRTPMDKCASSKADDISDASVVEGAEKKLKKLLRRAKR